MYQIDQNQLEDPRQIELSHLTRLILTIEQIIPDAIQREHYELAKSLTEAKKLVQKEIENA
jgi:hypothetical protein